MTSCADPFARLAGSMATLPARFHFATEPSPTAISLAAMDDPEAARELIAQHRRVRGLDAHTWSKPAIPDQVSASLTVQGIAMRVGGVALGALVLEQSLLTADAKDIYIGVQGPMFSVAIASGRVVPANDVRASLQTWAQHWLDGHLRRLVDAVRSAHRVGEALLWSNVASALASTLVFFDWWDPSSGAEGLADDLRRLGRPPLERFCTMADVEVDGRRGLRSERNSCCLLTLVPGAHLCPTCPKTSEADRRANTEQHVRHLFAVREGKAAGPPPWATRTSNPA